MNQNVAQGRTIQLFLTDGTPSGLTIATLHGWTGSIMVTQNATLPLLLKRPEAQRTGVYVLYAPDLEDEFNAIAYIGEADAINERLPTSAKDHGFWELAAVITASDESLTKAHVRYLEACLIKMAESTKRVSLHNNHKPDSERRYLPEADRANMDAFLANIQLMLPVVGIDLFRPQATIRSKDRKVDSIEFTIHNKAGVDATMVQAEDRYIVKAGSTALKDTAAINITYSRLKQNLINKKRLIDHGDFYRFVEDTVFSSPSAAAAVVLDRNANGRLEWKHNEKPYADWQSEDAGIPG